MENIFCSLCTSGKLFELCNWSHVIPLSGVTSDEKSWGMVHVLMVTSRHVINWIREGYTGLLCAPSDTLLVAIASRVDMTATVLVYLYLFVISIYSIRLLFGLTYSSVVILILK